jgi:hypothetical protein
MKSDNQTTDMFVPNRLEQELNRIAQDVDPPQVSPDGYLAKSHLARLLSVQ